ncbi:Transcription repressor [Nymphaea thermarum]|nr:Transcription repressor [Nymphaea thermarum]
MEMAMASHLQKLDEEMDRKKEKVAEPIREDGAAQEPPPTSESLAGLQQGASVRKQGAERRRKRERGSGREREKREEEKEGEGERRGGERGKGGGEEKEGDGERRGGAVSSRRFFFSYPGRSNSLIDDDSKLPPPVKTVLEALNGSGAVLAYSPDPYSDFQGSMQEMVEAQDLDISADWGYFQEMLACYLRRKRERGSGEEEKEGKGEPGSRAGPGLGPTGVARADTHP